jgi:DNA-binding transcriptional MerR regulator/methylmalonyl-CoA mutase cobalamin-binding subunit
MTEQIGSDNVADFPLEPSHPIQVVARRTGLSADVIRAWERRYRAVSPKRSPTSRRLYSDNDIERLRLLRQATDSGRRIGDVAHLPAAVLRELTSSDCEALDRMSSATPSASQTKSAGTHYEACLRAVKALDPAALDSALAEASVALTVPNLLTDVIASLMHHIGEQWRIGNMRACHEHMATAQIRAFLGNLMTICNMSCSGPMLLVATPAGQIHELGALMVAVTAASSGWQPLYLGPNVPGDEIVFAVHTKNIPAVALSICYPADDPRLHHALRRLGQQLSTRSRLLVGGAAAAGYESALTEVGAVNIASLDNLRAALDELRGKQVKA